MNRLLLLTLLPALACLGGLPLGSPSYPTTTPPSAVVNVTMPTLAGLTPPQRASWEAHLAADARWDVRTEHGCRYAVRMEPTPASDGSPVYQSTLNGFYSNFGSTDVVQTRVISALGCEHGFGADRGQIVRAGASDGSVQLVLEDYMDQPGTNSELLITGGRGVTLEIYEQSHLEARAYTQSVIDEVEAELAAAVAGTAPLSEGSTLAGPPSMIVDDGMQPGIYAVSAWANPGKPGTAHLRVIYTGPSPGSKPPADLPAVGEELSRERVRPRTARTIGHGADPAIQYRYQSELTVYEGDWGDPYQARFELWFEGQDGSEVLLVATERTIEGWMR